MRSPPPPPPPSLSREYSNILSPSGRKNREGRFPEHRADRLGVPGAPCRNSFSNQPRQIKGVDIGPVLETYRAVNEAESRALAEAFLSAKFLKAQYHFLTSKGKTELARIFWALHFLRPLWSKLL